MQNATFCGLPSWKSEIEAATNAKGGPEKGIRLKAFEAALRLQGEASWNDRSVVSGCIIFQFQMTQNFFEIATMNVHDDYLLGTASS